MKKRHFIVLFLFLSALFIAIAYRNADGADENKIRTVVQNTAQEIGKKAEDSAGIVLEKSKKVAQSAYESVKEEGKEMINSMIIKPSEKAIKDLAKKALLTVITNEEAKEILAGSEDSCVCQ